MDSGSELDKGRKLSGDFMGMLSSSLVKCDVNADIIEFSFKLMTLLFSATTYFAVSFNKYDVEMWRSVVPSFM